MDDIAAAAGTALAGDVVHLLDESGAEQAAAAGSNGGFESSELPPRAPAKKRKRRDRLYSPTLAFFFFSIRMIA